MMSTVWPLGLLMYVVCILYSLSAAPLQPHIRYEMVMFNQGLWHESTNYMGTPSNDTEAAWSNLVHRECNHDRED